MSAAAGTLVLLHGHGSAAQMLTWARDLAPAGWAVCFPQGSHELPGGNFAWLPPRQKQNVATDPLDDQEQELHRAAMGKLIAELPTEGPLIVGGFGMGGAMASSMISSRIRDRILGLVCIAATTFLPDALQQVLMALPPRQLVWMQGRADHVVPFWHAELHASFFEKAGWKITRLAHEDGHICYMPKVREMKAAIQSMATEQDHDSSDATISAPAGTFVLLHGLYGSGKHMMHWARDLAPPGWAVCCPNGSYQTANGGYSWTALRDSMPLLATDPLDEREQELHSKAMDKLLAELPTHGPLIVGGFSLGGAMASSMLSWSIQERILGMVFIGTTTFLPEQLQQALPALRPRPVMWMHGHADKLVPFWHAEIHAGLFEKAGWKVSRLSHDEGHICHAPQVPELKAGILSMVVDCKSGSN